MAMSEQHKLTLVNLDAEEALLGAILVDNRSFHQVSAYLTPDHFSGEANAKIFKALAAMIAEGRHVDASTLRHQIEQDGAIRDIGGVTYLARLHASVTRAIGAAEYGRTIYDLATRRQLCAFSDELRHRAETDAGDGTTVDELVAGAAGDLSRLATAAPTGASKRDVARLIVDSLGKDVSIFPTGISTLDASIGGGLLAGKMYGIAARKKIGKTILLGTLSHNLNMSDVPHLFIGLEMSAEEIEQRNVARELRFNSIRFLTATGDERRRLARQVADYAVSVANNTIYEHRPGLTYDELRRVIARHTQRGIAGIFLDYWQLVGGRQKNQTEEHHLREVAQHLANVAREEGVFVVVAAQVNQEGNTRGGEGLKLACDMYLHLHREKDAAGAWLEMEESRFTLYADVGTETMPGMWLHKRGPYFSEHTPPSADYQAT